MNKRKVGAGKEQIAAAYLEEQGMKITERNFRSRQGEIDIIAKDTFKNELVFIEVKTRTNFNYGFPIDAVNTSKQKHLLKACQYYLYKHHIVNLFVRIDVIEVFIRDGIPHIRHVKQIM